MLRPWLLWLAVAALALAGLAWQAVHAPGGVADPTDAGDAPRSRHGRLRLRRARLPRRARGDPRARCGAPPASWARTRSCGARSRRAARRRSPPRWQRGSSRVACSAQLGGSGLDVAGRHGAARRPRADGRHELVLPPRLLDGLDAATTTAAAGGCSPAAAAPRCSGFALLGFTAVYREGFEIVLFLQNLRLRAGAASCSRASRSALAPTAVVGCSPSAPSAGCPTGGCSSPRACCSASCWS